VPPRTVAASHVRTQPAAPCPLDGRRSTFGPSLSSLRPPLSSAKTEEETLAQTQSAHPLVSRDSATSSVPRGLHAAPRPSPSRPSTVDALPSLSSVPCCRLACRRSQEQNKPSPEQSRGSKAEEAQNPVFFLKKNG